MSTMRQVAERAGVSAKTVSRVINNDKYVSDDVRRRVETAVAELSYVPNLLARTFRSGRDAAIAKVRDAYAAGRPLQGWEVDEACRKVIEAAGALKVTAAAPKLAVHITHPDPAVRLAAVKALNSLGVKSWPADAGPSAEDTGCPRVTNRSGGSP